MQQILSILSLIPGYLIFLAIVLVILPTIVAILLRFCLYRHLKHLAVTARRLLGGVKQESTPKMITALEQRLADSNLNLDQLNTAAVIEGTYSQEKFYFLGLSLNCDFIDSLCRILPNLLLSFGLLGTFLGITFNLSSLSQTITQIDINNVRNLVEELNRPLQGMGVAFTTSLVAIACSSLLTVLNLFWNTQVAKVSLLSSIEDYIDNIFLPRIQPISSLESAISQFSQDFDGMVHKLGNTIEESMTKALSKIHHSAETFEHAANVIDNSQFPEKLASATNHLAIAQNQFSQSSLVLQKSTQSFEHNLVSMQKLTKKFLELNQKVNNIEQQYGTLVNLNQEKNIIEQSGLKEIQQELSKLIIQMNNQ
ncbi:MAG: methyl-accepting chemotaxis protein [Pleurocapsa sp. SU_5_0]|nr:methyl-accepting chemotaxis protein [Pleurocapsa sp. SU_5_0]NJR45539.1 methyl-accepting chemotaxis protein [Hyellaceae cyanobacterium CSU_1_1]